MKENIEEVIERLEKGINDVWFSTLYSQEDEERDLQILLSDYKRVLKENEELKIIKSLIQTLEVNQVQEDKYILITKRDFLSGSYKSLLDDYISKQKVKDKIEELNKKEQELQNSISDEEREEYSDASISFNLMDIYIRREVLQELIEESEENKC